MQRRNVSYWLLVGAFIGFGLITFDVIFISYPCLLIGLGLIAYGIARIGMSGLWAAFVSFGAIPALILWYDVITAPPLCPVPPASDLYTSCGGPASTYTTYTIVAVCFTIVAFIGFLWPLFQRLRTGYAR